MSKAYYYVKNGKTYYLGREEPAEILIESQDDLGSIPLDFNVGTIAYLPMRKKVWQLAPSGLWKEKDGSSVNPHPANPLSALTVDANIGNSVDLFGKVVSDLQSNVVVGTSAITGTLKYVADYSSAFGGDLSSGNYLVIHAEVPNVDGVTITVKVTNPVTLDEDGIAVLRIADKFTQTVTVTASKDGCESVSKVFTLTGLICQES